MAYDKRTSTNLAKWQFAAGISASQTTVNLKTWEGGLFPSTFPFKLKLEQYDLTSSLENKPVLKREIVKCTNRVWDVLTVVRGDENCPASDTATAQTNTQFAFDADDYIYLTETAWAKQDTQDEVTRLETDKADDTDVVHVTWNETVNWIKTFWSMPVWPSVAPTTNYQMANKKYVDDVIVANVIQAIQDNNYWVWEDVDVRELLFIEQDIATWDAINPQPIWNNTDRYRFSFRILGSWVAWSSLKLNLSKTWLPIPNLWIRIETDNAWEPSWTLVHANAYGSVASSSLTTSLVDTTITLAWSITLTEWVLYHVVLYVWTYWSETVDSIEYYSMWFEDKNTTARTYQAYDNSDWLEDKIPLNEEFPWTSFNSTTWDLSAIWDATCNNAMRIDNTVGATNKQWELTSNRTYDRWSISLSHYWTYSWAYNTGSYCTIRLEKDANNYAEWYQSRSWSWTPVYNSTFKLVEAWVTTSTWTKSWNSQTYQRNYFKIKKIGSNLALQYWSGSSWTTETTLTLSSPSSLSAYKIFIKNSGSKNGSWNIAQYVDSVVASDVDFAGLTPYVAGNNFFYIWGDLHLTNWLSLASALYDYKIPQVPMFAKETKTIWNKVIYDFVWVVSWFTLDLLKTYFLSDTPWAIQDTPWTYEYVAWLAASTSDLLIRGLTRKAIGTSAWAWTITLGFYPRIVLVAAVWGWNAVFDENDISNKDSNWFDINWAFDWVALW